MIPNIFLIVVMVVGFILLSVANFYLVVHFQHPSDKNESYFAKFVTWSGFMLIEFNVLMLSFDVANARTNGQIPTDILYLILYFAILFWALILVPFTFWWYEAEDPDGGTGSQFKEACCFETILLFIFFGITTLLYFTIGVAEIDVRRLEASPEIFTAFTDTNNPCFNADYGCTAQDTTLNFRVTYILYLISILTICGVVFFVCFGGIGLAAIPISMIKYFGQRPKSISTSRWEEEKRKIGERAHKLREIGDNLKDKFGPSGRPRSQGDRVKFNRFRSNVYLVEESYNLLSDAYNDGRGFPKLKRLVLCWLSLVGGIFAFIIGLLWVIHLFVFVVPSPPASSFLNRAFIDLDNAFTLFGVIFYAVFSFYLLMCIVVGVFKFGLRVPFLFSVHPMKVGETYMNSFLFNIELMLISSLTVVQFCAFAFRQYARVTAIDAIYNVGVTNLRGIKWIFRWYWVVWLFVAGLAFLYFLIFPAVKKKSKAEIVLEELDVK